jgi:hypothetical protein
MRTFGLEEVKGKVQKDLQAVKGGYLQLERAFIYTQNECFRFKKSQSTSF